MSKKATKQSHFLPGIPMGGLISALLIVAQHQLQPDEFKVAAGVIPIAVGITVFLLSYAGVAIGIPSFEELCLKQSFNKEIKILKKTIKEAKDEGRNSKHIKELEQKLHETELAKVNMYSALRNSQNSGIAKS